MVVIQYIISLLYGYHSCCLNVVHTRLPLFLMFLLLVAVVAIIVVTIVVILILKYASEWLYSEWLLLCCAGSWGSLDDSTETYYDTRHPNNTAYHTHPALSYPTILPYCTTSPSVCLLHLILVGDNTCSPLQQHGGNSQPWWRRSSHAVGHASSIKYYVS